MVGDDGFRFAAASDGRLGDRCRRGGGRSGLHGVDGIVADAGDDRRADRDRGVVAGDLGPGFVGSGFVGPGFVGTGLVAWRGVGFRFRWARRFWFRLRHARVRDA